MSMQPEEFISNLLAGRIPDGGRQISMVVFHHTWEPDHAQWQGDTSAHAIKSYWMEQTHANGWRNPLGGHLLIAPNGTIYLPFDDLSLPLNADSNLDANHHGIAIETVGNFDRGHDVLKDPQRHAVLASIGALLVHYNLPAGRLFFHNSFESYKTCPGTGLDLQDMRSLAAYARAWVQQGYKK